ncbi:hypothetical protein [Nocardia sp. NPDC058633]|uniref:hypothetical protein n=1 Tax=Nocardia sp. NPDC058633 TaxID=3346568 RepID=UPI0036539DDB
MNAELARLDELDGGHEPRPAAWMQRDDGSLWVVDAYGIQWPVAALTTLDELEYAEDDAEAALAAIGQFAVVDVDPVAVTDTEVSQ